MSVTLRTLLLLAVSLLFALPVLGDEQADPVGARLQADFPALVFTDIKPTPIPQMYEVVASGQIFYYFPETSHLMFGALIDKNGTNLTEEAKDALLASLLQELPLDKAVHIGNGPKTVIEVTDPDCPYCRKASLFFNDKDALVSRYVFFFPLLDLHPNAAAKAAFILSAEDRVAAYHDVMAGKYDQEPLPEFTDNHLLDEHLELTRQLGVRSTPQFWIDGENVQGANIPALEELILPSAAEPVGEEAPAGETPDVSAPAGEAAPAGNGR